MSGMYPHLAAAPIIAAVDLLAQDRLAGLGQRFRQGGGQLDWLTMLLVVLTLGIAIAVVWSVARHLSRKEAGNYHNHRGLFRELCRAHRLRWSDRRLLASVARSQGVSVPARMFVEPERFEPNRLQDLPEAQRGRAAKLCETLFCSAGNHEP